MFAKRCVKKQQRGGVPLSEGAEKIRKQNADNSSSNSSRANEGEGGREEEDEKKEKEEEVAVLKSVPRRARVPFAGKHYLTAKSAGETRRAEETLHSYRSDPKLNLHNDNRATAVFDADPDRAHDHRAILERNEEIGRKIEKGELESGIYRGQGAHRVYVHRSEGALSNAKSTGLYGPVRGTNNVRMTMYVDYNPEICKDYKETGYCGFGNTCKFLHDRHDYKGGWQIEREWQQQQEKKQAKLARLAARRVGCSSSGEEEGNSHGKNSDEDSSTSSSSSSDEDDEEQLPFACLKCKEKWKEEMNPVVTRCGHYFCEKCAFSYYSQSIKCYACGMETQGIFNAAHKLIDKVRQREAELSNKRKKRDGDAFPSRKGTGEEEEPCDPSGSSSDAGDDDASSRSRRASARHGGEEETERNGKRRRRSSSSNANEEEEERPGRARDSDSNLPVRRAKDEEQDDVEEEEEEDEQSEKEEE